MLLQSVFSRIKRGMDIFERYFVVASLKNSAQNEIEIVLNAHTFDHLSFESSNIYRVKELYSCGNINCIP